MLFLLPIVSFPFQTLNFRWNFHCSKGLMVNTLNAVTICMYLHPVLYMGTLLKSVLHEHKHTVFSMPILFFCHFTSKRPCPSVNMDKRNLTIWHWERGPILVNNKIFPSSVYILRRFAFLFFFPPVMCLCLLCQSTGGRSPSEWTGDQQS